MTVINRAGEGSMQKVVKLEHFDGLTRVEANEVAAGDICAVTGLDPIDIGDTIACPDRQVFAMEADGSGMYTLQALWTQARESLNVVNVIFANRAYRILQVEMKKLCDKENGPRSSAMMDRLVSRPPSSS